jgi:tetratricopeptide (TPR) repeat protein
MAKQLLIHAKRSDDEHDSLFRALQGLIFLSTPHVPEEHSEEWRKPLGILLIELKQVDSQLSQEKQLQTLARASAYFEDMTLPLPIMSTWETKPTKLKGLLTYKDKKHSKCILVDKHLARTHTGVEDIFPIHSDHKHTCVMETTNELGKHVMNFIADCLDITLTSEIRSPTGGATASAPDVNVIPSSSSPALSPSPPRMMDQMDSIATRMKKRQVRSLPELSTNIRRRLDPQLPLMSMESGIIIEDFVSRRDVLDRLDKTLSPPTLPSGSDTSVKLATLWGVGGIGKTSIAAEYMRTQESAYDALFWIRADGFQKILDSFERIAVMLKLVEADKIQDRHYARKLVMDWLEDPVRTFDPIQKDRLPRARWLLVFDNVDDFSLLKNFLPRHGAGSIIITSRDEDVIPSSDAPANKYAKGTVQVDPFPEHQAVEFLCRIAPKAQSNSHPQAELTVAQRLNCIPLALRQMGHYIDRNRLTFAEFLKVYENEATHEKLYRTSFEVEGSDYPYNISTVWRLQSLSPPTRSLLNVLSLLDPDHIQEEILVAKISNVPDSTYPLGNAEYFEARRELWSSSLISVQKDDGELSLHRIIQDAVRSKMDQEEFLDAFNMAASLLLEVWPIKGRMWHFPVDHWPKCGDLLGHVEKLRNCFNVKENPHFRNGPSPDPGFPQLLAYGGWFSHERGDSQEAKYFFDIAEKLCNSTKPLDEELLRDLWMCQGCVATETNDGPSCVRYYEKLLQKRQELTPKPTSITENEDLAIAYNEMGIGRMMMGNYEDAIDLLEVAKKYSDVRRVHTETTTSVYLLASANLGLAHWIEGHWDDALNILMKAHNVYQKQAFLNDKESFA